MRPAGGHIGQHALFIGRSRLPSLFRESRVHDADDPDHDVPRRAAAEDSRCGRAALRQAELDLRGRPRRRTPMLESRPTHPLHATDARRLAGDPRDRHRPLRIAPHRIARSTQGFFVPERIQTLTFGSRSGIRPAAEQPATDHIPRCFTGRRAFNEPRRTAVERPEPAVPPSNGSGREIVSSEAEVRASAVACLDMFG
jgi:hypothetical protein